MKQILTSDELMQQSVAYRGTGGVSAENYTYGYRPAFKDGDDGRIYLSTDAAGIPSLFHVFDGLPEECILERDASGKPIAVKGSLVVGFEREGFFFTREQVAQLVQWELDKLAS